MLYNLDNVIWLLSNFLDEDFQWQPCFPLFRTLLTLSEDQKNTVEFIIVLIKVVSGIWKFLQ